MKIRTSALNLLFAGICLFFIAIVLSGCSGTSGGGGGAGNLYGTVVNLSYSSVSNADVVVDGSSTKTLSNGTYSFINLSSGEKLIKISSSAYTSSYRKVSFSGGESANAGISVLANLDSKVTPIPVSGGTATNTNGSIKMVFPSGAFSSTTNVVLTTVPKVAAPYNPPEGDQFVSYIVFAKPEDTTLSVSAELSVPNLTLVPSSIEVTFYKFNTSTLVWEQLPGHGHSTTETGTINFHTDQMGWMAAIMPIYPAPGGITGTVTSIGVPVSGANVWTITSYDVTDSAGIYTLENVPVGTAEVYASALGYQLYTSSAQLVSSELQTTLNIDLDPIAQGNVEGIVKEWGGTALSPARVVGSKGGETYTDEYGRYTLYNILTGTTSITAYANEHVSSSETVNVIGGSTVSDVNFYLPYVGASSTYEFTFESSNEGFTTEADSWGNDFWHRQYFDSSIVNSNPQNYFNSSHAGGITRKVYLKDDGVTSKDGKIPDPHGGDYYFWYGQTSPATSEASYIWIEAYDDTAEGSGGISALGRDNSGTLESPALDLTGYTFGKLSFWTWWEIEGKNPHQGTGYDAMYVYASKSPYTSWDLLGYLNPYEDPAKNIVVSGEAYTSGGFNQPGAWVQHSYDLTPYAGNLIKIRFVFNTYDNHYNGFRGWFIDDITVNNSQFGISAFGGNGIKYYPSFPKQPRN
ncbi:MAG: carboxypeptidase regulatory-like domain-containing protein [bacterium]